MSAWYAVVHDRAKRHLRVVHARAPLLLPRSVELLAQSPQAGACPRVPSPFWAEAAPLEPQLVVAPPLNSQAANQLYPEFRVQSLFEPNTTLPMDIHYPVNRHSVRQPSVSSQCQAGVKPSRQWTSSPRVKQCQWCQDKPDTPTLNTPDTPTPLDNPTPLNSLKSQLNSLNSLNSLSSLNSLLKEGARERVYTDPRFSFHSTRQKDTKAPDT